MNYTRLAAIIAAVFIISTSFFVGKFDLYQAIPYLDKIFHFVGGAIAGLFFASYFRSDFSSSRFRYILAVTGAALLAGVLWEFAERLSSIYGTPWLKHYFYGGNINDTLLDLVADLAGTLLVVLGIKQKTG